MSAGRVFQEIINSGRRIYPVIKEAYPVIKKDVINSDLPLYTAGLAGATVGGFFGAQMADDFGISDNFAKASVISGTSTLCGAGAVILHLEGVLRPVAAGIVAVSLASAAGVKAYEKTKGFAAQEQERQAQNFANAQNPVNER